MTQHARESCRVPAYQTRAGEREQSPFPSRYRRTQSSDNQREVLLERQDVFDPDLERRENGGDKLVHGSGGISQPRAE